MRVLIGVVAALLITPTLIATIVLSRDLERVRSELERALSARVGLDVALLGGVSVAPGLRPAVRVRSIEITNRKWKAAQPLARLDSVVFEFDLWPSLRERRLVLRDIEVAGLVMRLHRNAEGVGNWVVDRAIRADAEAGGRAVVRFALDAIEVRGLDFLYDSAISEARFELVLESVRFENSTPKTAQRVRGHGRFRGEAVELDAWLGDPGDAGDLALLAATPQPLEARLRIGEARLDARGTLRDLRGAARARLDIDLELPDLELLTHWHESPLADALESPGPLTASARLIGEAGRVGLEAIALSLVFDEATRLDVRGEITDLPRLSGLDFAIELASSDLRDVLAALGRTPRGIVALQAEGRLSDRDAALHLEDFRATLRHEAGIGVDVSGAASRSEAGLRLDLATNLVARRLGDVFDLFPEQLGRLTESGDASGPAKTPEGAVARDALRGWLRDLAPVRASGRIRGPIDDARIDLDAFLAGDTERSWLEATGHVEDVVPALEGVVLDVRVGSAELRSLVADYGSASLRLDRVSGRGLVRSTSAGIGLHDAQLVAATRSGTRIELSSEQLALDAIDRASVAVFFESPSLSDLGEALGRAWPPTAPLSGRAAVALGPDDWHARDLEIVVGRSRLAGELGVGPAESGRRQVRARLEADRLDVGDFRGAGQSDPPTPKTPERAPAPGDRLTRIRDVPLAWAGPHASAAEFDLDLDLTIAELVGQRDEPLRDVSVSIHAGQSGLLAREVGFAWKGGAVKAAARIDTARSPPTLAFDVHARDLDLAELIDQDRAAGAWTGRLELRLDLEAEGERLGAVLDSMRGDVFLYARDGRVASRYSRALELDLVSGVAPERRAQDDEAYECMIVDLRAKDGKLTIGDMLFDTEYKQILGAGQVDLVEQTLDVALTPAFKGTTAGKVSASVRVTGPLADPKVRVEALTTAGKATRGLMRRALRPVRTFLPGVADVLGDMKETAEDVARATIPSGLWRPGIDVTCKLVLARERAIRARSRPVSDGRSRPSARTAR